MRCLFLRQQYTNYSRKNKPVAAKKLKDEQRYRQTKLIKSNNKTMSLLKPAEI